MSAKAQILVAEDGAIERHILAAILKAEGYRPIMTSRAEEALQRYTELGADVILADWVMPGMDGLELIRRVRAISTPVPPFIIMVTGRVDRNDLITALDAGADDYVTKPFDRRELVARIRGGVRTQQLMRELARNNDLLRRLAMTDPLTELPNRRAFDQWLTAERRWPDGPRPFGVIIADLNDFKVINDTYGHLVGDAALCEVAERLRGATRLADFVARYAGDEFVVGLPDCGPEGAAVVACRIEQALGEHPIRRCPAAAVTLTITTGVAAFPDDGAPEDVLAAADRNLYRAKAARRHAIAGAGYTHVGLLGCRRAGRRAAAGPVHTAGSRDRE
ncbi:MAG: diguanylate cyclase [Dehalococcoidia bacterium]